MRLDRTLLIPADDPELAVQLFRQVIDEEDCLSVVVLGDDEKSQRAVQCADTRAQAVIAGYNRKVVWIRDRNLLVDQILGLKKGTASLTKTSLKTTVAFSVSLADAVMDVVTTRESIDFVRLEKAFLRAGVKI